MVACTDGAASAGHHILRYVQHIMYFGTHQCVPTCAYSKKQNNAFGSLLVNARPCRCAGVGFSAPPPSATPILPAACTHILVCARYAAGIGLGLKHKSSRGSISARYRHCRRDVGIDTSVLKNHHLDQSLPTGAWPNARLPTHREPTAAAGDRCVGVRRRLRLVEAQDLCQHLRRIRQHGGQKIKRS